MSIDKNKRMEMQGIILDAVRLHKDKITLSSEWESYAKENRLPSLSTIYRYFGNWSNFSHMANGVEILPNDKESLRSLLREHIENVTTVRHWNDYAKKNRLPSSSKLINVFGGWNELKAELNLTPSEKKSTYSKEIIMELVKDHKDYLTTKKTWNDYVKGTDLPTYETIHTYMKWPDLQKELGINPQRIAETDLLQIAEEHAEYFTSMNAWDDYAKAKNLPKSITYHRRFGWDNVKRKIQDPLDSR